MSPAEPETVSLADGAGDTAKNSAASSQRMSALDNHQMHAIWPVGAEYDGLLDVAGA
jgi:hypothetical protein